MQALQNQRLVPSATLFWVGFPEGTDTVPLLGKAREESVSVLLGSSFSTSDKGKNFLRLCFGYETPEMIREGIDVLTNVFVQNGLLSPN